MNRYLLIQASDVHECRADALSRLVSGLAKERAQVTVFLVQNGVLAARAGASGPIAELVAAGAKICADEFSLRERAIARDRLAAGVSAAPIELVIDELAAGARALWC